MLSNNIKTCFRLSQWEDEKNLLSYLKPEKRILKQICLRIYVGNMRIIIVNSIHTSILLDGTCWRLYDIWTPHVMQHQKLISTSPRFFVSFRIEMQVIGWIQNFIQPFLITKINLKNHHWNYKIPPRCLKWWWGDLLHS